MGLLRHDVSGSFRQTSRKCRCLIAALIALSSLPTASFATDKVWSGATSTAWGTNTNWVGNAPSAGDNAVFNATFTNQPNVSSSTSVGGIWMTGLIGQNVTISGAGPLQIGSNTINGTAGLGILVDNSNTASLTISASLKLGGASETWRNSSANLFTVSGSVNLATKTLTVDGTGNTTISGLISNGTLSKAGTGTLTLSNISNSFTGQLTVQAGTVSADLVNDISTNGELGNNALSVILGSSGQTGTLEFTGTNDSATKTFTMAAGGTGAFQVDSSGTTLTLSGVIDGTGTLTKTGSGVLSLTGTNTYSGGTTINAGTLSINNVSSMGNTSGALTINAGTLEVATGFSTSRTINVGNAASTIQVDASQTYTVTNPMGGSGVLNKTGSGTLVLGGNNTYSGGTNVAAGTLQISASERLANSGALTVSGGTFDVQTFSETVGNVTLSSGTITGGSGGTLTGSAYALQSGTVSAVLAGSGNITKSTSGTVSLTKANTLTGSTTINAGTLTLAAGGGTSALGSTSGITVNSGGTLLLGASDQINNNASVTMAGGTLSKGNFSEGGTGAVGMGALTLTANGSHIDFGTGTVGVLSFASLSASTFTITIDNWTGNYAHQGSASTDRLIFDSDQSSNLNAFYFTGFGAGGVQFNLGGGFYEVVAAVPEPATYLPAGLAFALLVCVRLRRVISRRVKGRDNR